MHFYHLFFLAGCRILCVSDHPSVSLKLFFYNILLRCMLDLRRTQEAVCGAVMMFSVLPIILCLVTQMFCLLFDCTILLSTVKTLSL